MTWAIVYRADEFDGAEVVGALVGAGAAWVVGGVVDLVGVVGAGIERAAGVELGAVVELGAATRLAAVDGVLAATGLDALDGLFGVDVEVGAAVDGVVASPVVDGLTAGVVVLSLVLSPGWSVVDASSGESISSVSTDAVDAPCGRGIVSRSTNPGVCVAGAKARASGMLWSTDVGGANSLDSATTAGVDSPSGDRVSAWVESPD